MKKLFFSLALSLIVLSVNISAQVLDKDTEAATKKLFHPDLIGVELKLQGEYVGKDGEKQVGVQVVRRLRTQTGRAPLPPRARHGAPRRRWQR